MKIIKNIWWITLIIGIFFLSIGLTAILDPDLILSFMTVIVGIGFLFTGIKDLVLGLSVKTKEKEWWSHLVYSSINLALGIILILNPLMSLIVVLYYLAIWAIIRGVLQIIFGIKLPIFKNATITSGIIIIIGGILLLFYPEQISEVLITIIGIFFSIFGIVQIVQSSLRKRIYELNKTPKIKDVVVIDKE